ncbi:MAG: Maf family protein [Tissierellia bacterium]|nr:Maf family protein [Tissierellia bacterium]
MQQIILASKSPRRKELMALCGIDFIAESSDIDETKITEEILSKGRDDKFEELVTMLSYEKANKKSDKYPDALIIGSDTIVVADDRVFGKPKDEEDAYRMLRYLSGKRHQVFTGICILNKKDKILFTDKTEVYFHEYDEQMEKLIRNYIKSGEPFDKAGGYGIQGAGSLFINRIDGDFYSVMGMPVSRVFREIDKIIR